MAKSTTGIFDAHDKTWAYRWLNDEKLSVLQFSPDLDDHRIDQTTWPTDAEVSTAVGRKVRFVDAGDHPTAVECIFRAKS